MHLTLSDLTFLYECLEDVISQCEYNMPWVDTEEDKEKLEVKAQKAEKLQSVIQKEMDN